MQNSFLSLAHSKKLRCERFLDEMNMVIPWKDFIETILPHYKQKEFGRKKKDVKLMLKIYFLQQWYNLSDPGAEEAIYDRNSFQKFLGIDLLSHSVPDETTILNFRHLLEDNNLQKKFFTVVNHVLEEKGFILKKGTSVDASILNAPSSTKNKDKQRDGEMSCTKKNNTYYFGMKVHIGTDSDTGAVHSLETTTAKTHDSKKMDDLLHGAEKAIFGDKAYGSKERKRHCRKNGIFYGITDKGTRSKKLSSHQKKKNKKLSRIRSFVEHPFQILKCQWKHSKLRYRGLHKNTMQLFAIFSLINLYKFRKKLSAT